MEKSNQILKDLGAGMGYNIHTCDFINVQSLCKNSFVFDTLE